MSEKETRDFILYFDSLFPLDREYRIKYNIPFGSERHLDTCQIDIYTEHIETKMYNEFLEEAKMEFKQEEDMKKGIWIKERKSSEAETDKMFEQLKKIDLSKIKF